ncbi:hypothetical protein ACFVHW_07765 [Streptomyces sp. NPDC127110]|uniref:hypothetical protein n=1 Tax=Streptomyces sp. NPDC127110 TaxID=3345362 RepID=UPI003630A1EB
MALFGPSVRVKTYRMGWRRGLVVPFLEAAAPVMARLLEERFGQRLEPVEVTLTVSDGLAELACRAEQTFVPGLSGRVRSKALDSARQNAREASGHVVLRPGARGTWLLLNAEAEDVSGDDPLGVARVLCHEGVHCVQMGRAGVREARIAYDRHGYGVELLSSDVVRAYEALVEEHEREAYGLEDELAGELLRRMK